jgi:hypothetical protein
VKAVMDRFNEMRAREVAAARARQPS